MTSKFLTLRLHMASQICKGFRQSVKRFHSGRFWLIYGCQAASHPLAP